MMIPGGLAFHSYRKLAKQGLPKAEFAMRRVSGRPARMIWSAAYIWYAQAERHHYKDSDASV